MTFTLPLNTGGPTHRPFGRDASKSNASLAYIMLIGSASVLPYITTVRFSGVTEEIVLKLPLYTGAPPRPVYWTGSVMLCFWAYNAIFSTKAGDPLIAVTLYFLAAMMISAGLHLGILG